MPAVMTTCQQKVKFSKNLFMLERYQKQHQTTLVTFSSLFPPNDSNFTVIGSFLLLCMGGVGGVGVGVTKFCNNLFGGG